MMMHKMLPSKRRMRILRILSSHPVTFTELKRKTGINSTSLSIHLRKLQDFGFIRKEGREYRLSKLGRVLYFTLNRMERFITALERNPEFWVEHDLSPIPDDLLIRIGDLGYYEVLVGNPFRYIEDEISNAGWVRIVSGTHLPIHIPDGDVKIVVGKEVKLTDCKVKTVDDVRLICVSTNKSVILGLPMTDGRFDLNKLLISRDQPAIMWGKDVFKHFSAKAVSEQTISETISKTHETRERKEKLQELSRPSSRQHESPEASFPFVHRKKRCRWALTS